MKEKLIVWTIASLLPIALVAGNIDAYSTGPSGQGDLVYKAKATGVTNLAMGTGGLYNVTFDPRYSIGDVKVDDAEVTGTLGVTGIATLSSNVVVGKLFNAVGGISTVSNVVDLGTMRIDGASTLNALTASKVIFTDGSKVLTSTAPSTVKTNVLDAVAIASEIDVLDSIIPSSATALTGLGLPSVTNVLAGLGTPTTANAITLFAPHPTAACLTGLGTPTTTRVVSDVSPTMLVTVLTNATLQWSGTLYDSTGAALTNEIGSPVIIVTNVIWHTGTVVANISTSMTDVVTGYAAPTTDNAMTALGAATTAAAITGFGAHDTVAAVSGYAAPTTDTFLTGITSNVVQAAKTLSTSTTEVLQP